MTAVTIYQRWLEIWNGNLALANELIDPDCIVHQAPFGAGEPPVYRGPEGLKRMVEQGRAPFHDLTFRVDVGPIQDGDVIAGRWIGEGTYAGGWPGATAAPGTPVTFRGSDFIRLRRGKVAEYWVSSDGVHLMAQLGML